MFKLQKNIIVSFFVISMIPDFLFGMELKDSTEAGKSSYVGIRTGLYLSSFKSSSEIGGPHGYRLTVTNENGLKPGYNIGLFLDFSSRHHVSFQPELNYIWFRHKITYSEWWGAGSPAGITTNTDYELSGSVIQLCLLPKLALGKKLNMKILAGPFIRIPLSTRFEGVISREDNLMVGIGTIVGLRVDIPVNSDFVCFEIRAGTDISNIMSTPNPTKETSVTLGLSYLFRSKKNGPRLKEV